MKNCLSIKKFQFTSTGKPWYGMAQKTTTAERMRKMTAKRAAGPDFGEKKHQLKERRGFRNFGRKRKNKQRGTKKIMERREYEQVRKASQRKLKKDADANQEDKRGKRLEKYGKQ